MNDEIASLKKTARLAGLLYFASSALGFYSVMYVSQRILVKGNVAATVENILANEFLFRIGIVANIVSGILLLWLALVLYRLFKHVEAKTARMLAALIIVQIPLYLILETVQFASLMIVKGQFLQSSSLQQQQEMAVLLLMLHGYGIVVLGIFWGLWLLPFGKLIYDSGFIPRILGALQVMAGIGYTLNSFIYFLFPNYNSITETIAFVLSGLGEGLTILWLLIFGVYRRRKEENVLS